MFHFLYCAESISVCVCFSIHLYSPTSLPRMCERSNNNKKKLMLAVSNISQKKSRWHKCVSIFLLLLLQSGGIMKMCYLCERINAFGRCHTKISIKQFILGLVIYVTCIASRIVIYMPRNKMWCILFWSFDHATDGTAKSTGCLVGGIALPVVLVDSVIGPYC